MARNSFINNTIKRIIVPLTLLFFIFNIGYPSPSNSISIPNSFTPGTVISSADTNSNNNEVQTKYNAHTHSDITSLGTVTTGTWNASVLSSQYGGTGANLISSTTGGIIYMSNSSGTFAVSGAGTEGQLLTAHSSGTPTFTTVSRVQYTDTRFKLVATTKNMNDATGPTSYTGFGFQPAKISLWAVINDNTSWSHGYYDGTATGQYFMANYHTGSQSLMTSGDSNAGSISINSASGDGQTFKATSMDSDGFTGTWTRAGTPGATIQLSFEGSR